MKRTIYSLLLLVFAGIVNLCNAQAPVLISSNGPSIGYKAYYVSWDDTTGISAGPAGANVTWDFSKDTADLGTIDSGSYVELISPSSAPGNSFPTANFCIEQKVGSQTTYDFFILNDNEFADTVSDGKIYAINKVELEFPFTYQETYATTSQQVGQSVQNDTLTYDAYGTLITPFGTISNVVRIREVKGNSIQYQWWSSDPIFPVLSFDSINGSNYFITPFVAGISQINNVQALKISPNPSAGLSTLTFNLNTDASVNVSMFDISGREVRQLFNGNIGAGTNQLQVDDANIAPGMYFISVQANGQPERVKYIKL